MNFINCPKCKVEIEEDSLYCDQCGMELLVCSSCGQLGKGKRCTHCGQPLVPKKDAKKTPVTNPGTPNSTSSPTPDRNIAPDSTQPGTHDAPPTVQKNTSATSRPDETANPVISTSATLRPGANPKPEIPGHLVCRQLNLRLLVTDVIIGRSTGGYAHVFGQHGMVSGRHASISSSPSGEWQVTDLGSTNGTKVNGTFIEPNIPVIIHVGDIISFANLDFQVTP